MKLKLTHMISCVMYPANNVLGVQNFDIFQSYILTDFIVVFISKIVPKVCMLDWGLMCHRKLAWKIHVILH